MPTEGLVTLRSTHTPIETRQRLLAEIKARGLTLFAHIDHAAGAAEAGQSLRPTEVFLFGNARGGTPLMSARQIIGLDLPLKVLVWEDAAGLTWISYSDPLWLARRYELPAQVTPAVTRLAAALETLTRTVADAA